MAETRCPSCGSQFDTAGPMGHVCVKTYESEPLDLKNVLDFQLVDFHVACRATSAEQAKEIAALKVENERLQEAEAYIGGERDGDLNALIRFTEDDLGIKCIGPISQSDVLRLIQARVEGVAEQVRTKSWRLDFLCSQDTKKATEIVILRKSLAAKDEEIARLRAQAEERKEFIRNRERLRAELEGRS